MSLAPAVRPALMGVAVASATVAIRFAAFPLSLGQLDALAPPTAQTSPALVTSALRPDSLAQVVAAHDIFRTSRRPAALPFSAQTADVNAPPPPPRTIPPRRLSGILAGADTAALLDGIPGSEATRVVRAGDRIGEYTVRLIAADRVVMAGRDTSWTLRLRTP